MKPFFMTPMILCKLTGVSLILAFQPRVLSAEKSSEEILTEVPRLKSDLAEYERMSARLTSDYVQKSTKLNDLFIAALEKNKKEALAAENLELAVAIDARIKLIRARTAELTVPAKMEQTSGSVPSVAPSVTGSLAEQLTKYVAASPKSSENDRAFIREFTSGKVAICNPWGNNFYINKDGIVALHFVGGKDGIRPPDTLYPEARIVEGVLQISDEHRLQLKVFGAGKRVEVAMWNPNAKEYRAKVAPIAQLDSTALMLEPPDAAEAFGKKTKAK